MAAVTRCRLRLSLLTVECHNPSNLPFNRPNRSGGYLAVIGLGQRMIRTVWLATICLAVLSALAVGKALTPADPRVAQRLADETTVGTDLAQNTLSKADRLEITYVRQEILPQPTVQPAQPPVPAVSSTPLPIETKIISRHWHDPNAISSSAAKSKQTKTKQTAPNKKSRPSIANAIKPRIALNRQNS